MKWHTLLLIIFWPVLLKPAFAAGQLHVELRYPIQENGRRLDVGDGRVEVVLENTGDQTIEVYERSIPSINKSGVLTHHYFEVLNETSASARYVGILAYHDARSQDKYRTLAPGERHVIGVPIFRSYEVRPDYWYEVKLAPVYYLQQPLRHFSSKSNDDLRAAWVEAHAQPLVIRADGVSVRSERQASPAWGTAITPTPCSSNDLAALEMARVDAAALAQEALIHEANLYGYFFDENDEIVITFSPSLRYGKWFGKRGDPNASLPDDEYVSSTLLGTSQRLSNNEPWGPPITFTCECDLSVLPEATYAWVLPNIHYVINACPRLSAAPHMSVFPDAVSKVGTLIHEASHFSDMYGFGTVDHNYTYAGSAELALSERSKAVRNAHNYMFFILNYEEMAQRPEPGW